MSHPRTPRRSTIPVAGLLAVVTALTGVAGCGKSNDSSVPPAVVPTADFGGTDLAWIEITIAMDEQVEPLLALVPKQSRDAKVQALAQ